MSRTCCGLFGSAADDDHDYDESLDAIPAPVQIAESVKTSTRSKTEEEASKPAPGAPVTTTVQEAVVPAAAAAATKTQEAAVAAKDTVASAASTAVEKAPEVAASTKDATASAAMAAATKAQEAAASAKETAAAVAETVATKAAETAKATKETVVPAAAAAKEKITEPFTTPAPAPEPVLAPETVSGGGVASPSAATLAMSEGVVPTPADAAAMPAAGPVETTPLAPLAAAVTSPVDLAVSQPVVTEEAKEAPGLPPAVAAKKDEFDMAAFKEKMDNGVQVTKYNRHGKAATRVLYYDEEGRTLQWQEPGEEGKVRRTSSFLRKIEAPLPIATLSKVVPASDLSVPFCPPEDVPRSFQLVFPRRTVDFTAPSAAEAAAMMAGFDKLKKETM